MTLDRQIVEERLAKLEEVIQKLEQAKPRSVEELTSNDLLSDATLYRLQVGIEAVVDIGNHFLAEVYHKRSETYKDTIRELGNIGIISKEFAHENASMADFRNLVVHHYGKVDLAKVYHYLAIAPNIFREFAQHFAHFLEGHTEENTPSPPL